MYLQASGSVPDCLLAELIVEVMRNVDQYVTLSGDISSTAAPVNDKGKNKAAQPAKPAKTGVTKDVVKVTL